jgi:hypothetical protein
VIMGLVRSAVQLKALANALMPHGLPIFTVHGVALDKRGGPGLNVKANSFRLMPQSEQYDLEGEEYGLTIGYPRWVLPLPDSMPKFREGHWWATPDAHVCVKES